MQNVMAKLRKQPFIVQMIILVPASILGAVLFMTVYEWLVAVLQP
ncbi:hypothetical protein [Geomicrobium sp. JCM 19055]|nr:hypothetical protein [Geomicrobium sp. JCM 19055]